MAAAKAAVSVGTCPDVACQTVLIYTSSDRRVHCHGCGQVHMAGDVADVKTIEDEAFYVKSVYENLILSTNYCLRKSNTLVQVNGLSNYHCKLLSPLLCTYGLDKDTKKAKLLVDLNKKPDFECGCLSNYNFTISPEYINTRGYGRDKTGCSEYLAEILDKIKKANGNVEVLIPIHSDPDGHCLVHALSRAAVGRQLFWYPIRMAMKNHVLKNVDQYKKLLGEFFLDSEWKEVVDECDPEYRPAASTGEIHGLRNIHIFIAANVLRRPIILFDAVEGMESPGDYSGIFLPVLEDKANCRSQDGVQNSPLCIAWSNRSRNHYVALVGIKGVKPPLIPKSILPGVWCVSDKNLSDYICFDVNDCVLIGGGKSLSENYIMALGEAISGIFLEKTGIHPKIVCDAYQYLYNDDFSTEKLQDVISMTTKSLKQRRVFRCLNCCAVIFNPILPEWFWRGNQGRYYNLALNFYGPLVDKKVYRFPDNVVCVYDEEADTMDLKYFPALEECHFCKQKNLRHVNCDGTVQYQDGDQTTTRSNSKQSNMIVYKIFYNGKEYDNFPEMITLKLVWKNREFKETVPWSQFESDADLNSNAYMVASSLVNKNFPGEFGTELLVQDLVAQIFELTKKNVRDNGVEMDTAHKQEEKGKESTSHEFHPASRAPTKQKGMEETGKKMKPKYTGSVCLPEQQKPTNVTSSNEDVDPYIDKITHSDKESVAGNNDLRLLDESSSNPKARDFSFTKGMGHGITPQTSFHFPKVERDLEFPISPAYCIGRGIGTKTFRFPLERERHGFHTSDVKPSSDKIMHIESIPKRYSEVHDLDEVKVVPEELNSVKCGISPSGSEKCQNVVSTCLEEENKTVASRDGTALEASSADWTGEK